MKGVVIVKKTKEKQDKLWVKGMRIWFKEMESSIEENDIRLLALMELRENHKKQMDLLTEENNLYKKHVAVTTKTFARYLKTHSK